MYRWLTGFRQRSTTQTAVRHTGIVPVLQLVPEADPTNRRPHHLRVDDDFCLLALGVDPILEVLSRHPPLATELDRGKTAAPQLTRHNEGRHIHIFTDVGDGEPLLADVDGDAVHAPVLPDSWPLV